MKQYIRNFEKFVLNEQNKNIITSSEYKKAISELRSILEPVIKQWEGKTVNLYFSEYNKNKLFGNFKIQMVRPKYYAGKEELQPYITINLVRQDNPDNNGSIYAYKSDLQKDSFKVGKRGFDHYAGDHGAPGDVVTNKALAKSILTKWPQIEDFVGKLSNIKNKLKVPDADFTASINKDLGGDDIQASNVA